jgi:hypothetical protein
MRVALLSATLLVLTTHVAHARDVGDDPVPVSSQDDAQDQVVGTVPSDPPSPDVPVVVENPRLACIRRIESHNDPNATNRYSGAMGLYQFLPSTWRTTPQGRAGLSAYDPVAATAAANWMLSVGRAREWDAVRFYGC